MLPVLLLLLLLLLPAIATATVAVNGKLAVNVVRRGPLVVSLGSVELELRNANLELIEDVGLQLLDRLRDRARARGRRGSGSSRSRRNVIVAVESRQALCQELALAARVATSAQSERRIDGHVEATNRNARLPITPTLCDRVAGLKESTVVTVAADCRPDDVTAQGSELELRLLTSL